MDKIITNTNNRCRTLFKCQIESGEWGKYNLIIMLQNSATFMASFGLHKILPFYYSAGNIITFCLVFWRRNTSSYSKLHLSSTAIDGPVFWDVTLCHWVSVSWHFVGTQGFHLSPSKHSGSAHPTTEHYIPDGFNLQPNRCENLKSRNKAINC